MIKRVVIRTYDIALIFTIGMTFVDIYNALGKH